MFDTLSRMFSSVFGYCWAAVSPTSRWHRTGSSDGLGEYEFHSSFGASSARRPCGEHAGDHIWHEDQPDGHRPADIEWSPFPGPTFLAPNFDGKPTLFVEPAEPPGNWTSRFHDDHQQSACGFAGRDGMSGFNDIAGIGMNGFTSASGFD